MVPGPLSTYRCRPRRTTSPSRWRSIRPRALSWTRWSESTRKSAPAASRVWLKVPAQNEPSGATAPSLNRTSSGRSVSSQTISTELEARHRRRRSRAAGRARSRRRRAVRCRRRSARAGARSTARGRLELVDVARFDVDPEEDLSSVVPQRRLVQPAAAGPDACRRHAEPRSVLHVTSPPSGRRRRPGSCR